MTDRRTDMRRRQFLATGTAILTTAVAGCGHPTVVLAMDAATARDIANQMSIRTETGSEEQTLVTTALENGTATRQGRYALFDRTNTVEVNGTFYEVSETRLKSSEVTIYEVSIDLGTDDATPEIGAIEYDALPEVDKEKLDPVFVGDAATSQPEHAVSVEYGTADAVGPESVFVPERQYDVVVHDGNRYAVAINSKTAPEAEYQYQVTEVAAGVDAFAQQLREQYLFELGDLSDAEREIVEEAIESGYYEDDDAFRSVIEKIRAHEGLAVHDSDGTWLVEYEGDEYLADAQW